MYLLGASWGNSPVVDVFVRHADLIDLLPLSDEHPSITLRVRVARNSRRSLLGSFPQSTSQFVMRVGTIQLWRGRQLREREQIAA
jgi:hypothetical protein